MAYPDADAASSSADERALLAETMSRPWVHSRATWNFLIGLQERSDVPFSAVEKSRLARIYREYKAQIDG